MMSLFVVELTGLAKNGTFVSQFSSESFSFKHQLQLEQQEETLPLSIFTTISGLQAIVKYLHEQKHYSFAYIAKLLNRDQRTVWTSYAAVKHLCLSDTTNSASIPLHQFSDRTYSILEHLVYYLKQNGNTFSQIARMLNKDPRTIWTAHHRYMKRIDHE
jgi:hypothetical protein